MLYRVMGASGSGKTEYMMSRLGEAIKNGKKCFFIVPEQQSVEYESTICERFGDSSNLFCEVLNFERLPNRVAREFGGLAVNNIDKGGACALLSLVAESLKPSLKEYSSVAADPDFAMSLFALVSRMKMAMITPSVLKNAIDNASDDARLLSKLEDIYLIYSEYDKYFTVDLFDPRDALTRLANELPEKPFFKGSYVFIDSYYTFTEQEYAVIKEIISQSAATYVSFTVDSSRSFFDENDKAAKRVRMLSDSGCEDYVLGEVKRIKSPYLRHIERNIWNNRAESLSGNDGSIKIISAKNRFDEAEAAASEILSFVRAGGRFRDIAVLAGNTDAYSSILESVFSRAEIPCFFSSKESLETKSLFSFLLSSLGVIIEDFSLKSMKRYIKSGYTDLTASECDVLLAYASSWKLRGKAWYGDNEWTLNPEGYSESDISERGAKLLLCANKARNKVVPPLSALRETLLQKPLTVEKGMRALYDHLIAMRADERLRLNAERYLKNGDRENSDREIQLWKLLINIIDQLVSTCGDRETTPKRLMSLLKLMCECYSLGAIPASSDSVMFGSASLARADGRKMVVVVGCNDGEFPASVGGNGFFDRVEAVKLEEFGIELADTIEKQLNTNRFHVYAALSAPSEKLVLLYPKSELTGEELRPSSACLSLQKMFPDLTLTEFLDSDMIYSRESVAAYYPSLSDGNTKVKIAEALAKTKTSFYNELPSVKDAVSKIDFKDDSLYLSPSRFERYNFCPFSYFGEYILGLKQKKENQFASQEMGNYIHKLLDKFVSGCVSDGRFNAPDESERKARIRALADEYLKEVIGEEASKDKRFMHIFDNMTKTVDLVAEDLCNEFSRCDFVPVGFEYRIGRKDGDMPAVKYEVDGKPVLMRGSIDRVDVAEIDGVKYARVVDYKSYNKDLNLNLVKEHGIDTQMLHYLFAYCNYSDAKPAGVIYYRASTPNITVTGRETPEEIKKMTSDSFKRDGIFLNDKAVARAMNPDEVKLPIRFKDDGDLAKNKRLISEEEFVELSEIIDSGVEALAENIFGGNMNIAPDDCDGKKDPCEYCSLADLCRMKNNKEVSADESDFGTD